MFRTRLEVSERVRAPIDVVFEGISDHEGMRDWPGVTRCRLVEEGSPRNGVGAVREITARGLTLREKIILFEPPHRYDYTIVKGLPVKHHGIIQLSEQGDEVEVSWQITMSSRIPLLAPVVGFALRRGLSGALRHFKRKTESAA